MPRAKTGSKRGNNEGSIYQRLDGRWVGGATISGGSRKYVYGRTRQEASKKLTAVLKNIQDDTPIPSERLTVADFAKGWLESIRPSIRPKTYESYEATIRVHVSPTLGPVKLSKLKASDLERLYAQLIGAGSSPKSIRAYNACIHSMLEKAVRQDILVRNVAKLVDLPRSPHRELPMITPEQAQAFLRSTEGHRLEALFVLAISTGARQGELLGLTWDRIHWETDEMDIRQALQKVDGVYKLVEPKNKSSFRVVALSPMAVAALRTHWIQQTMESRCLDEAWGNPMDLVFTTEVGTPLDKDNLTKRQYRSLLKHAGLPAKLRFHDLRHIAASLALSHGVPIPDVSQMLGHSDAATTLRVYAHALPGAQRKTAHALQNILTG